MAKWEYKIIVGNKGVVEYQLNDLAKEGWEPVNVSATTGGCIVLLRRAIA